MSSDRGIAEEHFPGATGIVDLYHAREHLGKLAKLVHDPKSPNCHEMGSQEALLALLDRFTISASPSRQDEEKEEVFSWIIGFGEAAVPALI